MSVSVSMKTSLLTVWLIKKARTWLLGTDDECEDIYGRSF